MIPLRVLRSRVSMGCLAALLSGIVPPLPSGPAAHAAQVPLYLYAETPKFFPDLYGAPGVLVIDWFWTDGVIDDNVYCIRLSWDRNQWAGFCWRNDDGDIWENPGLDLSGVVAVKFRAKREGAGGNQIKVEYINNTNLQYVTLGSDWGQFTLDVTNPSETSGVWSLLSFILYANSPERVYIDDVRLIFERAPSLPVQAAVTGSIFDRSARLRVGGWEAPVVGVGYGVRSSEYDSLDLAILLPALAARFIRTWGNEATFGRLDRLADGDRGAFVGYWLPTTPEFASHYDSDPIARRALKNDLTCFLDSFRDHPAVVGWLIGNEVWWSLREGWSHDESVGFFELLDTLAVHAKSVDPDHPVGYADAAFHPMNDPGTGYAYLPHAAHLDFYGANAYGELRDERLQEYLNACVASDYDTPVIVTEFGAHGWWEIPPGGCLEFNDPMNDGEKAQQIADGWNTIFFNYGLALGGCVFNWIDKIESGCEGWTRWGIFGGVATGDLTRDWRAQAYTVRQGYTDVPELGQHGPSASIARVICRPNPTLANRVEARFRLNRGGPLRVEVFDPAGRVVLKEQRNVLEGGEHAISLTTERLSSGTYLIRVSSPGEHARGRFQVVR